MDVLIELIQKFRDDMYFDFDELCDAEGNRMYGEYNTALWWKNQTQDLPDGPRILALEIYADATELDGLHKQSGHPIYLSFGNLPLHIRNNPKSKTLLGFFPLWYKGLSEAETNNDAFRHQKREVYHQCAATFLDPIRKHQDQGFLLRSGLQLWHLLPRLICYPGDIPEHLMAAQLNGGNMPCIECQVLDGYLAWNIFAEVDLREETEQDFHLMLNSDYTLKKRTEEEMAHVLRAARGMKPKSKKEKHLKLYSLYDGTQNAFAGLKNSPLYELFPSDFMMHDLAGMDMHTFDYLLRFIKTEYRGKSTEMLKKVCLRFDALGKCRVSNFRLPTNSIVQSANLTATERRNISKVLLLVMHGLLEEEHMILFSKVMVPLWAARVLLQNNPIPEKDLDTIQHLLEDFCLAFVAMFDDVGDGLQFPKLHGLVCHLANAIRCRGSPFNWCCAMYENLHSIIKMNYKNRCNKKNVDKSLANIHTIQHTLALFDSVMKDEDEAALNDASPKHVLFGYLYVFHIVPTRDIQCKLQSLSLSDKGADDVDLQRALLLCSPLRPRPEMVAVLDNLGPILEAIVSLVNVTDGFEIPANESDEESEYADSGVTSALVVEDAPIRKVKDLSWVKLYSGGVPAGGLSRLLANPNFHNLPRYTNVKLSDTSPPVFAKILAFLSVSMIKKRKGSNIAGSAWIQLYEVVDPLVLEVYGCPHLKLSDTIKLVALDHLGEEVHMVPDFERMDVLEE
ncbi:hypothetical protein HDU98_003580, partial [Podochytrium sp. JEL0797]